MIDLHSHTDQSDGTATPEELVRLAVAIGLKALAVTDHDTLAGYDLAVDCLPPRALELVCGIELSTRLDQPGSARRSPSVHLLGYFVKAPPSMEFRQWLLCMQESRRKRNVALIERLQSLGLAITLEEVQAVGRNLTGRPHFAQVLLKRGYVTTIQEAFDLYLADHAKAAVEREEPTLEEGIRRIASGGGLPSLAHPVRLEQSRDPNAMRSLIARLIPFGLQGIEVIHSDHAPGDVALFESLAEEFQLARTGGSDFHGLNKPGISLGSGRNRNVNLRYSMLEQMREYSTRCAFR